MTIKYGEIRLCKFCQKDITADWPRLKKVCDSKECRDKQCHDHVLAMRERDRKKRLKKKTANPRVCKVCKKPLPITQHASKKTCPECKAKWETEVKRKAAIRAKKRYDAEAKRECRQKVAAIDREQPVEFYIPQPGDFSQAEYEKEQAKLDKLNGRKCSVCGRALKGNQWRFCSKCRKAILASADVVRCDDGWCYDQAGSNRYNWSLAGE